MERTSRRHRLKQAPGSIPHASRLSRKPARGRHAAHTGLVGILDGDGAVVVGRQVEFVIGSDAVVVAGTSTQGLVERIATIG